MTEFFWSDWDADAAGIECEPGVGLTVGTYEAPKWLSWDETVAFYNWLGSKIKEAEAENARYAQNRSALD